MDTLHSEGAAAEWKDTMELGVDGDADEFCWQAGESPPALEGQAASPRSVRCMELAEPADQRVGTELRPTVQDSRRPAAGAAR